MHPTFPCPNPLCTHLFALETVRGASSLVCPKCGTVFPLRAASPAPAQPDAAETKAVPPAVSSAMEAAVPIAQPVVHPAVSASPPSLAGGTTDFDFLSASEKTAPSRGRTGRRRGKRRLTNWMIGLALVVLGLALSAWGGLWLRYFFTISSTDDEAPPIASAFNARFVLLGKGWKRDKDVQMRLHVHLALTSPEHNSHMALLFKDYKDRLPSDAELIDEAVGKLRLFFKGLEWELRPPDAQTQLASHPARLLRFQGDDAEHVTMNGECYALAFRGYGYWFFTWAPLGELERDGESIRAQWDQLRQGFSLLDGRKGWKEKAREKDILTGKKAKYQLACAKGLWTSETTENEEPPIDLLLRGHEPDPERKPLASKDAVVQVLVLPPQPDLSSAASAALDYIKQREKKLYERTVWEPIKDKNGVEDRDIKIGTEPGRLSKWHVKSTEDLERFLVIAVVNRPEGVVVLLGDCLWERRDFWDQEFTALFQGFQVK